MQIKLNKKLSTFMAVVSFVIVLLMSGLMIWGQFNYTNEIATMDMFQIRGENRDKAIEKVREKYDIQSISYVGEGDELDIRMYTNTDKAEISQLLSEIDDIEYNVAKHIPQFVFPSTSYFLYLIGIIFVIIISTIIFLNKISDYRIKIALSSINLGSFIVINSGILVLAMILSLLSWQIGVFTLYVFASIQLFVSLLVIFLFKTIVDIDAEISTVDSFRGNIDVFIQKNFIFICKILLVLTAFSFPLMFVYDFTVEVGLVILAFWFGIFGYLFLTRSFCDIFPSLQKLKVKSSKKKKK